MRPGCSSPPTREAPTAVGCGWGRGGVARGPPPPRPGGAGGSPPPRPAPTNWRGRPLTSHEVIVETIAATATKTGLTVKAALDTGTYEKGIKISDKEMKALEQRSSRRHDFHGEWNYALLPASQPTHPTSGK